MKDIFNLIPPSSFLQIPTGVVTAWSMGRFGRWITLFLNLALILICSAMSLLKVDLGKMLLYVS